ncbi:hypothetical protein OG379_40920 (plasmid) [Streptomyces sp. NBC_01166]|uniref:hypothetical protein n=1 Tax=Streptomyces sp. NBC_01166 TaxID=2903755 RepID=UPI00386E710E|nr:hypothetical protein OG379_40920 [Streptomyces sp. NBC_01166]
MDPMTYVFKGAGFGLTKVGDAMAGLKGLGTIEIPPLLDNVFTLPKAPYACPTARSTSPRARHSRRARSDSRTARSDSRRE